MTRNTKALSITFAVFFLLITLLLPVVALAEMEIVIQRAEIDDGRLVVDYLTNDLEDARIVSIELSIGGQAYHRWHRDNGQADEKTTYSVNFRNRGNLLFSNDEFKYPAGEYQLTMVYDESGLSGTRRFTSSTMEYNPPAENLDSDYRPTPQAMSLPDKVDQYYEWAVEIVSPIAIIILIYGGYLYITSTGNPEQIGMAKELMVGAITGIIVLLLAGLILSTVDREILNF